MGAHTVAIRIRSCAAVAKTRSKILPPYKPVRSPCTAAGVRVNDKIIESPEITFTAMSQPEILDVIYI